MEIIRHYLEVDEIIESIKKIADNLDKMTRIMEMKNTIARPLPDYDPEILLSKCPCPDRDKCDSCGRTQEVQDLKLENDRLTRRNKLMEDYIHAVACITSTKSKFYHGLCDYVSCPYYNAEKEYLCRDACRLNSKELIEQEAAYIIDQLEDI